MMVEPGLSKEIRLRLCHAGTRLGRTIDQARHARVDDRTGTHQARFQGHEEGAAFQPIITQTRTGIAKGENLGMGTGIVTAEGGIESGTDDFASRGDYDRSHWHLTGIKAFPSLIQGSMHVEFITAQCHRLR